MRTQRINEWETAVALALATGTAAFTITRTKITEPMREHVKKHTTWGGNLITCPYCTGHWLAAAGVAMMQPQLTNRKSRLLNFGVSWLAVTAGSAIVSGRIKDSIKP